MACNSRRRMRILAWVGLVALVSAPAAAAPATPVSFDKQIRPIFQANCYGCHQPAKAKGGYVMTDFAQLLKGGESDETAVVAGQPEKSSLLPLIVPKDGEADMPKGKKPLHATEIELVRRWIAEGAKDD